MSDIQHEIRRALQAGARGLLLIGPDELRGMEIVEAVGESLGWPVHTWTASSGVDGDGRGGSLGDHLTRKNLGSEEALWVLLDPGPTLLDPRVLRAIRETAQRTSGPAVVLIHPTGQIGEHWLVEHVPELWTSALPPMDAEAVRRHLRGVAQILEHSGYEGACEAFAAAEVSLGRVCLGLARATLDRLLAEAVLEHDLDTEAIERFIGHAKPTALDPAGLLTPAHPARLEEVGGLHALKEWLSRRALALDFRARAAGIGPPRGLLLLGVQGCGKSLAARATASALDLPLVRLDPGRLFAGLVGQTEANLRRTLEVVEQIAPAVLWLDEIDKGLAGSEHASGDSGTTARVVGGLLTWLQERKGAVFVVATANRVDALPPELLRKGRLDEVFFVDLPDADAREEILRVHLDVAPRVHLGVTPPMADDFASFAAVARSADGFSGAEIEAALVEARLDAFAAGRPLAASDLQRAVQATVPLSVLRSEEVESLRLWASRRARSAS